MGLHTGEDRIRCLGNAIIRDTSLIISRAPAPGAGSAFPWMRQAPSSRGKRKVELVVVTLPERGHLKLTLWALIGHWFWIEKERPLNKTVQFRSWVVLAHLFVPALNYILYRCVHTFLSEASLWLEWCLCLIFLFFFFLNLLMAYVMEWIEEVGVCVMCFLCSWTGANGTSIQSGMSQATPLSWEGKMICRVCPGRPGNLASALVVNYLP